MARVRDNQTFVESGTNVSDPRRAAGLIPAGGFSIHHSLKRSPYPPPPPSHVHNYIIFPQAARWPRLASTPQAATAPRTGEMRSGEQATHMELTSRLLATAALMLQPYLPSCSTGLLFSALSAKRRIREGRV